MSVSGRGAVLGLGVSRHQIAARGVIPFQPRASQVFQPGSAVVHRIGAALAEVPTARTDLVSLGTFVGLTTFTASSTADSNGGAVDPVTLLPQVITIHPFDRTGYFTSALSGDLITYANIDQPCFWVDDDTLALTDRGGTLSFAGIVDDVIAAGPWKGYVVLRSNLETRALYELYSASEATPGVTSDDTVSYVMTNLPAGAFAAGVWTATSTGALNTTQDGLTVAPAVGDKVLFPPGTITTQVVTGAQSGPYECVTAGAVGVKAVYQRTAKFAHGATITPGTKVKVTLGGATTFSGTTWRADPTAANKVVDTDDPVMFPERVIVQKSCSSGTATIATVPLRAAGKFAVLCDWNGGSPAATATTIQATTQTPGAIGTASIIIFECVALGTTVGTGTGAAAVTVLQ